MLSFFSWSSPSTAAGNTLATTGKVDGAVTTTLVDSPPDTLTNDPSGEQSTQQRMATELRQKMAELMISENEYITKSVDRIFITHEGARYELEIFHQREEIDLYRVFEGAEEGRRLDGAVTVKIPRLSENEALLQRRGEPFFPSTTMRQWVIISPEFQESRHQYLLAKEKYMDIRKQLLSFLS